MTVEAEAAFKDRSYSVIVPYQKTGRQLARRRRVGLKRMLWATLEEAFRPFTLCVRLATTRDSTRPIAVMI